MYSSLSSHIPLLCRLCTSSCLTLPASVTALLMIAARDFINLQSLFECALTLTFKTSSLFRPVIGLPTRLFCKELPRLSRKKWSSPVSLYYSLTDTILGCLYYWGVKLSGSRQEYMLLQRTLILHQRAYITRYIIVSHFHL